MAMDAGFSGRDDPWLAGDDPVGEGADDDGLAGFEPQGDAGFLRQGGSVSRRVPGIENHGALERHGEWQDAVEGLAGAVHDEIMVAAVMDAADEAHAGGGHCFLMDTELGERRENGVG